MTSYNKLKEINIKNRTQYYFDDTNINDFDSKNVKQIKTDTKAFLFTTSDTKHQMM